MGAWRTRRQGYSLNPVPMTSQPHYCPLFMQGKTLKSFLTHFSVPTVPINQFDVWVYRKNPETSLQCLRTSIQFCIHHVTPLKTLIKDFIKSPLMTTFPWTIPYCGVWCCAQRGYMWVLVSSFSLMFLAIRHLACTVCSGSKAELDLWFSKCVPWISGVWGHGGHLFKQTQSTMVYLMNRLWLFDSTWKKASATKQIV